MSRFLSHIVEIPFIYNRVESSLGLILVPAVRVATPVSSLTNDALPGERKFPVCLPGYRGWARLFLTIPNEHMRSECTSATHSSLKVFVLGAEE